MKIEQNLEKYLDQPLVAKQIAPPALSPDPEVLMEEKSPKIQMLRNPKFKQYTIWGVGALGVLLVGQMHGCNPDTSQSVATRPEQARIKELEGQVKTLSSSGEREAAARQAKEYTSNADKKTPAGKNTGKKQPINRAYSNQMAAYNPPRRNYSDESIASNRVASLPVAFKPSAAPAPRKDNSEVLALRKQLTAMSKTIADLQSKGQNSEVASSAVEDNAPDTPEIQPVAYTPPAQIDGGVQETALLTGVPPITIDAGIEAKASLDIGVVAGQRSRVVGTLKEAIASGGRTIIPAGSRLLGYVNFDGDVAQVSFESAVVNGNAIALPGASQIMVVRDNKEPLMAKSYGGNGFWGKFASAALGGISSGVGQLISPDTTSTIGNGFSQTVSQSSGRTLGNAGLAALGGVSNGLSTGLQSEIQSGMQQGQTKVKGIKAGQSLRLIFLAPTQVIVPGLAPVETAQLPTG
jgi:hypothetical protein